MTFRTESQTSRDEIDAIHADRHVLPHWFVDQALAQNPEHPQADLPVFLRRQAD